MTSDEEQLQHEIIATTDAPLLLQNSFASFREKLSLYINELINHDFEKLISILYRVDVSEKNLKETLAASSTNAGSLITDLIIDRQLQKIKSRQQYRKDDKNISEEERW